MKREHTASAKAFKQAINHCRISLATGQMANRGDISRYFGIDVNLLLPDKTDVMRPQGEDYTSVTPVSIKDFNGKIVPILEQLHSNPPALPYEQNGEAKTIDVETKTISVTDTVKSIYEEHPIDSLNWIPPRSPKQTANLYPAQTKASKDLAYKLFIENLRGVLLRASVGVGKTYMYFQLIRWAWDKGFFKDCISPWPCLIITKASIVEQTKRVGASEFGLDPIRQFTVINYDALRSSKGLETMIEMKYEVHGGIRYEVFKWRPHLNPRLAIVDESQSAKNDDSKQAKIVRALAQLPPEILVRLIFSSATPFTRVSEAKYLTVNCGIPYRMI